MSSDSVAMSCISSSSRRGPRTLEDGPLGVRVMRLRQFGRHGLFSGAFFSHFFRPSSVVLLLSALKPRDNALDGDCFAALGLLIVTRRGWR